MAADYELPVWSIRPNWSDPIIEVLEWLTDVMRSDSGAEQRIAMRLYPRRTVEAKYNPTENERTFAELALQRLGRAEWMFPLWFDGASLTSASAQGTSRLNFVTEYHEFTADGMAFLVGPGAFTGEAVRISGLDSTGIDLAVPLDKAWPAGSTIHPMRRGRFEQPGIANLTSRVGEFSLRFESVEGNEISDEGAWPLSYGGLPVINTEPNWSDSVEIDLSWIGETFDPGFGLKKVVDQGERAFRQQQHSFMLCGAQEQFEFRQMLYRLRGQQTPIWLPTFSDDLTVAVQANAAATSVTIEECGYAYVGGPSDGRNQIYLPDGQIVQVDDAVLLGGGQERIDLAAGITNPLLPDARLSFIDKSRLAQDSVEIRHETDINGVAVCGLGFVAFSDRRTATEATTPIPAALQTNASCGSPEEGNDCAYEPPPEFEGWDHEWTFIVQDPTGNTPSLSYLLINYPGAGGVYDWTDPHGPTETVWERSTTGGGGEPWVQKWKMNRTWPSGEYIVTWDPQNFPGGQTYQVYARKWNNPNPTLLDSFSSDTSATKNRPFMSGDS